MVRPWYRIKEDWTVDNNPDISTYLGYGDIVATYERSGHMLSLLLWSNLNFSNFTARCRRSWSFRYRQLKGYVQVFTGYGKSVD